MFRRHSNEPQVAVAVPALPSIIKGMEAVSVAQQHEHEVKEKGPLALLDLKPDSTICQTLHIKGELEYDTLLRVDGSFEGRLLTKGSLIVGPSGRVVGDLAGMRDVLVDGGRVEGAVACERLMLRCGARAHGDVTCASLTVDASCKIKGQVAIN